MTKLETFMNQGNEKLNMTIFSIIAIAVAVGASFVRNQALRAGLMLIVFTPCAVVLAVYAVTKIAMLHFKNHGVRFVDGEKIDSLSYVSKVCFNRAAVDRLDNPQKLVKELEKIYVEPVLLTAEDEETAAKLAKELGLYRFIANCDHNQRNEYIKQSQDTGHKVCLVGSCSCGIAEITLPDEHLPQVPHLISIARGMRRTARCNLFISILFNVAVIALGYFGLLGPVAAAYINVIGSGLIVVNAVLMTDRNKEGHSLCQEWPLTYDELVVSQLNTQDLCSYR